jgi:hypothetical protein
MKLLIICFFISLSAFSQTYRFRLEGTYSLTPGTSPAAVNFTLQWNEFDTQIRGIYKDNYYSGSANVEGITSTGNRTMNVIFPDAVNGAKNITFLSSQTQPVNGAMPLSITVRDASGATILTNNISGIMSSVNASNGPDGTLCSVGFGSLTGFCGLYAGTVTEGADANNRCNLVGDGSLRMELSTDKSVNIFLNYTNSIQGLPVHRLGAIPLTSLSPNIDQRSRNCGTLAGTSFFTGNCQSLQLTGSFNETSGSGRTFTGTYTITDETSAETCTLSLNLERSTAY